METTIVNIIQAMLAPGLMISACGLLLLGMINRHAVVVARFRLLNEERRQTSAKVESPGLSEEQKKRLNSVIHQLERFRERLRLLRNSVISYFVAVAFFILSSFFIGLKFTSGSNTIFYFSITAFLLGMFSVFCGVIFSVLEILRAYKIVLIEITES